MISIFIAEDQQMLLGALGSLLNLEDDMEVVGKGTTGQDAVDFTKKHRPDVCIMDIEMPGKTGLEAAEELKDTGCNIIILTTFARPGYFQRAIKAGVKGYLLKDSPSEELVSAIRSVMKGKRIYAPELMEDMYSEANPLTDREKKCSNLWLTEKTQKKSPKNSASKAEPCEIISQ